ncbi:src like adaptor 1a [Platichthys flesus]|uniref:src like adaptor 1a n=1 Tax=Platichthys flesus TaxID=8260 RepID=UPI002DC04744|nr:src like adaptor 1a [Platichthys flesus]
MPSQQANYKSYRLEPVWKMGNMMKGGIAGDKLDNFDSSQKSSEDNTVVVLQDYPSSDISEPIYRMGEKLQVLAQEGNWWRVRSVQSRKENYIPNTHAAKVYHGWLFEGVERQKAEELLLLPVNRVGAFLVRESGRERGQYSLSVRHRNIKHYRIFRLDNSWYYISPRLTFQCLEDMVNHYSDAADGLCCVLTAPCLSAAAPQPVDPAAPPVVMRRNFDWKKVDRRQLVSTESCSDNAVSYGVRNSIAAYLSFSETQDNAQFRGKSRKKKSKSVYVLPDSRLQHSEFDEDF